MVVEREAARQLWAASQVGKGKIVESMQGALPDMPWVVLLASTSKENAFVGEIQVEMHGLHSATV